MTTTDNKRRSRNDPLQRTRDFRFSQLSQLRKPAVGVQLEQLGIDVNSIAIAGDLPQAALGPLPQVERLPDSQPSNVGQLALVRNNDGYDVPNIGLTDQSGKATWLPLLVDTGPGSASMGLTASLTGISTPLGVSVSVGGNVTIAIAGNVLRQYTPSFGTIRWSVAGTMTGTLYGICADSALNIFAASSNTNIYKWSGQGAQLTGFTTGGPIPYGLAIGASDNIFAALRGSTVGVRQYSNAGATVRTMTHADLTAPYGVAVRALDGHVFVSDRALHCVFEFDAVGAYVGRFGTYGNGYGQFNNPGGLAFSNSGRLVVVDSGNDRVQLFDSAYNVLDVKGSSGTSSQQFRTPQFVNFVPAEDYGYVSDNVNSRLTRIAITEGGIVGPQGVPGPASYTPLTLSYTFSTNTTIGDPGSGSMRLGNANPTLNSDAALSGTSLQGPANAVIDLFDDSTSAIPGYVRFSKSNGTDYQLYTLGALYPLGAGRGLIMDYIAHQGAFANGDIVHVTFEQTGDMGNAGPTGATGAASTVAGPAGATGAQGAVGAQGAQGATGPQGAQGATGPQGAQGNQGAVGTQGAPGAHDATSIAYVYSTTVTDADPGNGQVRANNATLASATQLYVDLIENGSAADVTTILDAWDDSTSAVKGYVRLSRRATPERAVIYALNSITTVAGYRKLNVAYVGSTGGVLSNFDSIYVSFSRTGDLGATGGQGIQGNQGATGPQGASGGQGIQGNQGATGPQGPQGVVGATGPTGLQGVQGLQGFTGPIGPQGSAGVAPGSSGQVVYNKAGNFAGDAGFTYDDATDKATIVGGVVVGASRVSSTNKLEFYDANYWVRAASGLEINSADQIQLGIAGVQRGMVNAARGVVGGGLDRLGAPIDISGTNQIQLIGIFSAAYRDYIIEFDVDAGTASGNLYFRLMSGSTPISTGVIYYYHWLYGFSNSSVANGSNGHAQNEILIGGTDNSANGQNRITLKIKSPFRAAVTGLSVDGQRWYIVGGNVQQWRGGGCALTTTSYDGVQLFAGSGNITARATAYGVSTA